MLAASPASKAGKSANGKESRIATMLVPLPASKAASGAADRDDGTSSERRCRRGSHLQYRAALRRGAWSDDGLPLLPKGGVTYLEARSKPRQFRRSRPT